MKTRSTILLLLVVAALAAYVFFFERHGSSTREKNENSTSLAQFDSTKITGLDITNGDTVIQLRKKGDQWVVTKPIEDRANAASVTPILTLAADLQRTGVVDHLGKGGKLRDAFKDYGVQKAKVRLKLIGEGAPAEIHFGKDTAFEGKIYARLETDDSISVVKSDLRNLLVKDVSEFRDKHLTRLETSNVSKVKIKTQAGEINVALSGDHWNLETPIKARAADSKVQDLISNINNILVEEFVSAEDTNLAMYGLAEPRGLISLQAKTSDELETIQIGSPTEKSVDKIYIRVLGRPSILVVPKNIGMALGVAPNDLRDNKLTRISSDLIDRITIEKPGEPALVLTREQEHWAFLDNKQPANETEVERLINVLNNTETKAYVDDTAADLKPYGLDQPVLTIRLSSYSSENTAEAAKGETVLATVQFGKTENDIIYAQLAEEPFVVSVGSGILTNLPLSHAAFEIAEKK